MPRSLRQRTGARALALAALSSAALWPSAAGAVDVVYLHNEQADAVHDAGAAGALRQMPAGVEGNPRWPAGQRIAKVSANRDRLMERSAAGIAALFADRMNSNGARGLVAVDELNPNLWTPAQALELVRAMGRLGPDARRVVFYASSPLVEQVGRTDPREPLAPVLARMVNAMSRARMSYLQTYRRDWMPMDAPALARHLPRWERRWPAAGGGRLGLLVGPALGTTQADLWGRLRATPSGRTLIANGVAIAGGRAMSTDDALAWVTQYHAFRAAPGLAGARGEAPIERVGAPRIEMRPRVRPRARYALIANRPGRAVVRLVPLGGPRAGAARVIRVIVFGAPRRRGARLPADIRPGRYRLLVTFSGQGARERARRDLVILPRIAVR